MNALSVAVEGATEARAMLNLAADRMLDLRPLLNRFGRHMVTTSVPKNFRAKGRPDPWPTVTRFGADASPLRDTGRLLASVGFKSEITDLLLTATAKYARVPQYGATITPKRSKFLAIPVYPALSISEIHAGKGPRDFPGAFVLMDGPAGPGVYAKSASAGVKGVKKLFSLTRSVTIKPRPFLLFQTEDVKLFTGWFREFVFANGAGGGISLGNGMTYFPPKRSN